MNKTLNLVIRLFVIAAIAALVLGLTNMATDPIIKEREAQAFKDAYSQAYPDGQNFETIEEGLEGSIKEVIEVTDGTNQIGYVFSGVGTGGYGGDISYIIGVNNEGIVQGFKPITHSETPGYGAKMEEQEFIDGVTGIDISKGVSYGPGNPEAGEIHAISGATLTTSALANSFQDVAIKMSELSDAIAPVGEKEVPYYASYYQEVFEKEFGTDTFKLASDLAQDETFVRRVDAFKGDEIVGHVIQLSGKGFGGPLEILLGVDTDNKIVSYNVASHNETPDYGAVITEEIYTSNIVGKSLNKTIKLKADPTRDQDILYISGATVTSMAMQDVMNDAVEALKVSPTAYDELDINAIAEEEASANAPDINYAELFEGVEEVELVDGATNDFVTAVHKAMAGGTEIGYIIDAKSEAFHGDIEAGFLVDPQGIIQQLVYYHNEETDGFGSVSREEGYIQGIIGENLNNTFKANGDGTAQGEIQAISGATWTTDAMTNIMNGAAEVFKTLN